MRMLSVILIVALAGCDNIDPSDTSTSVGDVSILKAQIGLHSAAKAQRDYFEFNYDLEDEEPFIECRGELMAFHGILTIKITETTTPSGNLLVRGWVEYSDEHWAEGVDSGDVWTLRKGLNPYTETLKGDFYSEDDFWVQNWQILEWYENPELGRLKIQWWGGLKYDKNGEMTLYRDRISCK